MASSLHTKIGLASALMMASVLASRLVGLLREMTIAWVGGAGAEVDAYQLAFLLPEILNHLAATGFLSVTFIPLFAARREHDSAAAAWESFSVIGTVFGAAALLFVLAGWAAAPALVRLLAPGVSDPAVLAAATRMTRIIVPAQFFFFAGSLLMAVQFACGRFLFPALAPLVYNLGIIAGGVLLAPAAGIEGFAWGVLAGAFAGNFLLQVAGARRAGLSFTLRFRLSHPDVAAYLRLTLPLMVGLTMGFSSELFFRFFGSYLPDGGVAALNFGLRMMLILVGVFGQAPGTASFPFLAGLAAAGRREELHGLLDRTLRALAWILPAAALLAVVSPEAVRLLFQRGRFGEEAVGPTAAALRGFLPGAAAYAAYALVVRGFYATGNTWLPALYGTAAVLASLPLYPLGLAWMGLEGVAWAVSLSGILQAAGLYWIWSRRAPSPRGRREVAAAYLRLGLFALAVLALLSPVRAALAARLGPGAGSSLALLAAVSAGFALLLAAAARLPNFPEAGEAASLLRRLLARGRGRQAG